MLDHDHNQHHRYRQDDDSHAGHDGIDGQHHDDDADDGGHRGDELGDRLVEALTQGINIVCEAREHFADRFGLKGLHRHAVNLLRDIPAQPIAQALGHAGHNPALNEGKQGAEQVQTEQQEQNGTDLSEIDASRALHLGNQAGKQFGSRLTQNLRADDVKQGTAHGEQQNADQGKLELSHVGQQTQRAALKVLGLLARHHTMTAAHRPSHRSLTHAFIPPNSFSDSCDRAIS